MPLFACEHCDTIDNTALAPRYWRHGEKECTRCSRGVWHDRFPEQKYDPDVHGPLDEGRRLDSTRNVRGAK